MTNTFENYLNTRSYSDACVLRLTRTHLEKFVEEWAVECVAPALAGCVESAFALSCRVGNEKRGVVAVLFWQAKVSVPAFVALLDQVWSHDHRELINEAGRRRLRAMFRYAKFELPAELPDTVRVWRGSTKLTMTQASKGLSWTTRRDVACWFAMRHAKENSRPLVISALVKKDKIKFFSDAVDESEVVVFDIENATVDGASDDWQLRFEEVEAKRDVERKSLVTKASKIYDSSLLVGQA